MKQRKTLNQFYFYLIISVAVGIILFAEIKDIFYFDEDVFVANSSSVLLPMYGIGWQRLSFYTA